MNLKQHGARVVWRKEVNDFAIGDMTKEQDGWRVAIEQKDLRISDLEWRLALCQTDSARFVKELEESNETNRLLREQIRVADVAFNHLSKQSERSSSALASEVARLTEERDELRVHCTIADQTLDELNGIVNRYTEARARIKRLEEAGDAMHRRLTVKMGIFDHPEAAEWSAAKEAKP
jgi:chromosome segregation ATPase